MSEFKVGDVVYFKGDRGIIREVMSDDKERLYRVDVTETAVHYLSEHQFEIRGQELNDNQQIVFEWLKEQRIQKDGLILPPFEIISNLLTYVQQNGDDIFRCFALMSEKEQAEVLAAFAQWALEQEGK